MFALFSLSNKKTYIQAILFYIVIVLVTFACLISIDFLFPSVPVQLRVWLGQLIATLVPFLLGLGIITTKKITQPINIVIMLLTFSGLFFGILIGMLPVLYLTIVEPTEK